MKIHQTIKEMAMDLNERLSIPELTVAEFSNIRRLVKEYNRRLYALYIDAFAEVLPKDILKTWCNNSSMGQLKITKHPQSRKNVVLICWTTTPLSDIVIRYCPSYPKIKAKKLEDSLRQCTISNGETSKFLKEVLQETFSADIDPRVTNRSIVRFIKALAQQKPKAPLFKLFAEAVLLSKEEHTSYRNITRHPAWCWHNKDKVCSYLGTECHTTINCPYFIRMEKLPSGGYITKLY